MSDEWVNSPRIIALVERFEPDNSGGCCPICANGSFDAQCDTCRSTRFERREVFDYAEHVDHGAYVCHSCTFPIRDSDGRIRDVCWLCLCEDYDVSKLKECPECFVFDVFEGSTCSWCKSLGPFLSVLMRADIPELSTEERAAFERLAEINLSQGRIREVEAILDADMLERLKEKRLVRSIQCGAKLEWQSTHWLKLADWRREKQRGRKPRELRINRHYDDIVALLERDDVIEVIFRYITKGREDTDNLEDFIWDELDKLDVNYWSSFEAINGLTWLACHSEVSLEHPKYGEFFKAIRDSDCRTQIKFLEKLPLIPECAIELRGEHIISKEAFEEFLNNDEEMPPELRVRVLATVWLPDNKEFNQSIWDLLGETFPRELATTLACQYVVDPRARDYDNWMGHRARFSPEVKSRLLEMLSEDTLLTEDMRTKFPVVGDYAERGTGLSKVLGRLLSGKEVRFEAPLTERLVWMMETTGTDRQVLSTFSDSLANYPKQDMKERIIESEDRSYRNKFLEALHSVERYEEFLEFSKTPLLSLSLLHAGRYLRAGVRAGKYDLVESWIRERLAHHEEGISKLEASDACRKSFQILNTKFDMVFSLLALNLKEDAQRTLDEAIRYLEDLIDACRENSLPFSTYQWVLSCIAKEGRTDDPKMFFDAVNKAHFLETSWDNPGPCTAYWSKGLGEDRIEGVQLTRDFHESLLELVIELSQAFSERSGVS